MSRTTEEKISIIEKHFGHIMEALDLDLTDESLKDTPKRVAKMYVNELFIGINAETPKMTKFPNSEKYDQMLIERNINTMTVCEHHFLPIVGKTHIAYIPNNKVVGLSKLIRTVQHFQARPQIQERLTQEIAAFLVEELDTQDVAVIIDAAHYCCGMRGVKDIGSTTITSYVGGKFRELPNVKQELFTLLGLSK